MCLRHLLLLLRLFFFDDDSDNDGSGSRSYGTFAFPFCSVNYVGCVSAVDSGVFAPTGIESIGDFFSVGSVHTNKTRVQSWLTQ